MNTSNTRGTRHPLPLRCAVVVILCLLGCVFEQTAIAQSAVAAGKTAPADGKGKEIFESTCAACHGLDGRGGERGPDISMRQQVVQLSDPETLEILRQGIPASGMPPFASLGMTKLNSVLQYLRSLQGKGLATVLSGDPQRGKAIFFGKGRCSECHMVRGEGGFIGRDLTSYGATLSLGEIRKNILQPADATGRSNKTAVVTLKDLRAFSGIIRNEDNFSVQLQSFDGAFHLLMKSGISRLEFRSDPIMPANYGATLSPAETDDLINYLVTVAKENKSTVKRDWEEE